VSAAAAVGHYVFAVADQVEFGIAGQERLGHGRSIATRMPFAINGESITGRTSAVAGDTVSNHKIIRHEAALQHVDEGQAVAVP
jgi:hypothetical protein